MTAFSSRHLSLSVTAQGLGVWTPESFRPGTLAMESKRYPHPELPFPDTVDDSVHALVMQSQFQRGVPPTLHSCSGETTETICHIVNGLPGTASHRRMPPLGQARRGGYGRPLVICPNRHRGKEAFSLPMKQFDRHSH